MSVFQNTALHVIGLGGGIILVSTRVLARSDSFGKVLVGARIIYIRRDVRLGGEPRFKSCTYVRPEGHCRLNQYIFHSVDVSSLQSGVLLSLYLAMFSVAVAAKPHMSLYDQQC